MPLVGQPAIEERANSVSGFGGQGQNGWQYGYDATSNNPFSFVRLTHRVVAGTNGSAWAEQGGWPNSSAAIWQGGGQAIAAHALVWRWTSTFEGPVTLHGLLTDPHLRPIAFSIFVDGMSRVYQTALAGPDCLPPTCNPLATHFDVPVILHAGSIVDFVITAQHDPPVGLTTTITTSASAIPVFYVNKNDTPVIWLNDATAIRVDGYPSLLHFDNDEKRVSQRRGVVCSETRRKKLGVMYGKSSCDEYPFATTEEGGRFKGRLARTVLASNREQSDQAKELKAFYKRNHLTFRSVFIVQPVP